MNEEFFERARVLLEKRRCASTINDYAIRAARLREFTTPRCDLPIGFLPTIGQVLPSDILPIWRNNGTPTGITYGAPIGEALGVSMPPTVFNVMTYGALGDGVTNDLAAIQAAANAAGVSGGIVWFPVPPGGAYIINGAAILSAGPGTVFMGASRDTCIIRQTGTGVGGCIHFGHDYCECRNLQLDASLSTGAAFIGQNCNYCVVDNCIGQGSATFFEVFWFYGPTTEPGVSPPNQPVYTYNYGNRFTNNIVNANFSGGNLDFSHQANAYGCNNILNGYWITAYQCDGVEWNTTYFSAQTPPVGSNGTDGFVIVAPSTHATIRNFWTDSAVTPRLSSGNEASGNPSWGSIDTVLDNVFLGAGSTLSISDCTGTRISRLYMDQNTFNGTSLNIGPESTKSSPNPGGQGVQGLKISDSTLPQVHLGQNFNGAATGAIYDVVFTNCTFPVVAYTGGSFQQSLRNSTLNTVVCNVSVNGGLFQNAGSASGYFDGFLRDDNLGPLANPSNLLITIVNMIGYNFSGLFAGPNWLQGFGTGTEVGGVPIIPATNTLVPNYPGTPFQVSLRAGTSQIAVYIGPTGGPAPVLSGIAIATIPAGNQQIVELGPDMTIQVVYAGGTPLWQWWVN